MGLLLPISLLRSQSKFDCIYANIEGRKVALERGGERVGGVVGKKNKHPNSTLSFKIFLGTPQQR